MKIYAFSLEVNALITSKTPTKTIMETGKTIHAFCTKPAKMYPANDTAATVNTYGNCVDTWLIWSHFAPVLAIMVVSEIGEQWSPQTAPARQAERAINPSLCFLSKSLSILGLK